MQVRSLPAQMPALILASNGLCRIFLADPDLAAERLRNLTRLRLADHHKAWAHKSRSWLLRGETVRFTYETD